MDLDAEPASLPPPVFPGQAGVARAPRKPLEQTRMQTRKEAASGLLEEAPPLVKGFPRPRPSQRTGRERTKDTKATTPAGISALLAQHGHRTRWWKD